MKVAIFDRPEEVFGFIVQAGFVGIIENNRIIAISSGWDYRGSLYVYRQIDDEWKGGWESYLYCKNPEVTEMKKALLYLEQKKDPKRSLPR